MRLTAEPLEASFAQAWAALDRRLLPNSARPIVVALSGGGDSVALMLLAAEWAARHRRPLVALTVDHRLNPQSGLWTEACRRLAATTGAAFEALSWTEPKPQQGLPAAARAARHRLLADAARKHGAGVLLMGHTADDVLEARLMRREGSSTPEPAEWAPSPAWPQGRGLFLLRPLLAVRRAAIRQRLQARGESWIEDPANADPRFARSRVRPNVAGLPAPSTTSPATLGVAHQVEEIAPACLSISRAAIRSAPIDQVLRLAGLASVCAGGGDRLPSSASLAAAAKALRGSASAVLSLAGARIEADACQVRFVREAGERARGGLRSLQLAPGACEVWDGRFEVRSNSAVEVRALRGVASKLSPQARRALGRLPPACRPALPVFASVGDEIACPSLEVHPAFSVRSLVGERFAAAAGLVLRESD